MRTPTRRGMACLVPAGALVLVGLIVRPASQVAVADETTDRFRAQAGQFEWQGVGSCSATGCHDQGKPGKKFNEVRIWEKEDKKHADTYRVTLYSDRSKQIVKNLRGLKTAAEAAPHQDALCLHCHSMNVPPERRGKKFSPDDGVGCESCHGPAGKWFADHQRAPWKLLTDQQKEQRGFRPLKNLEARAKVCVDCHVGSPDASVNHDLIAAGHPRLIFEFGAYHANLPKHWELADEKKGRPDFELRVWLAGQAASALAATELLEARARSQKLPWPEFAEYDCFACHHNLSEPSWRRDRGFGGRTPGSLSWGAWYFTMPRTLATQPQFRGPNLPNELDALTKALTESLLNRDVAMMPAGAVRKEFEQWSDALRKVGRLDAAAARELLKALIDAGPQAARADWESATQLFLALAAANDALADLDPNHPADEWKKSLRDLFKLIDLETRYDSPRRYSPKPIEARLAELRKRLK